MQPPVIGVVGPCAAGKTTLIRNLANVGIIAKHIAQEHSFVPTMWERLSSPDILIFLDVAFEESMNRRKQDWEIGEFQEQQHRLRHARQYADFYLDTTGLSPHQVLDCVLRFLNELT